MFEFLSAEWIAAAAEVRERYRGKVPDIPVAVTMNIVVSDAPPSVSSQRFALDTSNGALTIEAGEFDAPDATVSTNYDLARSLLLNGDGQRFMQAFLEGDVLLQGDMAKLMLLQATIASNADEDAARELADEIRAITADDATS